MSPPTQARPDARTRGGATLGLLNDPGDAERARELSTNHYGGYAAEVLEHAGLPFRRFTRLDLRERDAAAPGLPRLLLLPYPVRLVPAEVEALAAHVESGGAVVACGGVEGAEALFGIQPSRRYAQAATVDWPDGALGLPGGRMPAWNVHVVRARAEADSIGELTTPDGEAGAAAVLHRAGAGVTCYLAVDVMRSVVTMQQGLPVLGDAASAPDGTAPLIDGIRKSDDGAVVGWEWREASPEGPVFLTPYADRLRDMVVGAIAHCASETGTLLPMTWYWPHGLPAVGSLSFDTDSNEGPDGWAFRDVLDRLRVNGTWCVMYPGGYPRELYDALRQRGDEIALHYDALTSDLKGVPHCGWSEADFSHQLEWLKHETGVSRIVSQKNHVTRWEGWVELFRWIERSGIVVDQTKGPSKIGNLGFTFGTCHPWRPLEDARHGNRIMDLLELPFLTHDMHHSARRVELRRRLVDAVIEHHGVGHFIFHPQRIHEEGMPEALADLVAYARERNVEWWTSERIASWEAERRAAKVAVTDLAAGTEIRVSDAPEGLTVLIFGAGDRRLEDVDAEPVEAFGERALRVTLRGDRAVVALSEPE